MLKYLDSKCHNLIINHKPKYNHMLILNFLLLIKLFLYHFLDYYLHIKLLVHSISQLIKLFLNHFLDYYLHIKLLVHFISQLIK